MNKNPANNKRRGSVYERKLVNIAKKMGLNMNTKRAYASNGESLGEVKEVDLLVEGWRIQAKKRAKLPAYLKIDKGVDAVVFSMDRGEDLCLITYLRFLELLQISKIAVAAVLEVSAESGVNIE